MQLMAPSHGVNRIFRKFLPSFGTGISIAAIGPGSNSTAFSRDSRMLLGDAYVPARRGKLVSIKGRELETRHLCCWHRSPQVSE